VTFYNYRYILPELILSGELLQQVGELVKPQLRGAVQAAERRRSPVKSTISN
jgi:hypothetical protein